MNIFDWIKIFGVISGVGTMIMILENPVETGKAIVKITKKIIGIMFVIGILAIIYKKWRKKIEKKMVKD